MQKVLQLPGDDDQKWLVSVVFLGGLEVLERPSFASGC